MPTHHDFLRRLLADPADDLTRVVYADWLDELGDADARGRAEFLRLECAWAELGCHVPERAALGRRLTRLALLLPTRWKAAASKADVWFLDADGRGCCPPRWDRLRPTDDRKARACPTCGHRVVYCATVTQATRTAGRVGFAFDHNVTDSFADPEFAQFHAAIEATRDALRRAVRAAAAAALDPFAGVFEPTQYTRTVVEG